MEKIKILVAADSGSIHAARFVNLLQEIGYDTRLFQSEFTSEQDEHLQDTVIYTYFPYTPTRNDNLIRFFCPYELSSKSIPYRSNIWSVLKILKETIYFSNKRPSRVIDLIRVLKSWKPDIVFSLKMQNDGYTVSRAKKILGDKFPSKWVHFCWGTDIEFFAKDKNYSSEHLPKIKRLLERCDFFLADSLRDVNQVSKYGFKGTNLGQLLANGGFDLSFLSKIKTKYRQKRDIILIKGREGGYIGKAYNILTALHRIPNLIKKYRIKIIMATPEIENTAYFLKKIDGIDYEIIPRIPYQQLLEYFAQSRIAISATTVDGTPSFLIEAMAMGAFPIHSDMESIRDWVKNNVNGLLFPVDDISQLTTCIKKALTDDQLVNQAKKINWKIAKSRTDRNKIKIQVKNLIERKILINDLRQKQLVKSKGLRILQIGITDLEGKRFNGADLSSELRKLGVQSEQCVWNKSTNDPHTWQMSSNKHSQTIKGIIKNVEHHLSIQSLLYPYAWRMLLNKSFRDVDLVHYHIIYPNFFSLLSLPILTHAKPSIWTLHDPWPITGHCIHPFDCKRWKVGCGSCPYLNTPLVMKQDRTALMWKIKKLIYKYSNLDIVVASQWMLNFAKESPMLSKFRIHFIPFGINLNIFKPSSSVKAKMRIGVYPRSIVLAFRASLIDFKGFQFIKETLHKLNLKQRICLLSFDSRGLLDEFRGKYQVIDMGWINDDQILVNAYNAADIFLMPSLAEAFGLMAVEAMACKKPVVVFSGTALEETIFAPKGGIAVPYKKSSALLAEITNLILNSKKRKMIGEVARKIAEENYDLSDYVRKHIEFYKEVIDRRKN